MKAAKRETKVAKGKGRRLSPDEYFVQLPHGLLDEPAWRTLKPGARILYVALKRYYNGRNNGGIFLSVRKAAADTGISRGTVERHFQELIEKGFIRPAEKGHLGVFGRGQATAWVLTEVGLNGAYPTKDFKNWEPGKQKPVISLVTGCHHNEDGGATHRPQNRDTCPSNEGGKQSVLARACHQNGDTSRLSTTTPADVRAIGEPLEFADRSYRNPRITNGTSRRRPTGDGGAVRRFAIVRNGVPTRHGVRVQMDGQRMVGPT